MVKECDGCGSAIDVGESGAMVITGNYEREQVEPMEDLGFDWSGDEYDLCEECGGRVAELIALIRVEQLIREKRAKQRPDSPES